MPSGAVTWCPGSRRGRRACCTTTVRTRDFDFPNGRWCHGLVLGIGINAAAWTRGSASTAGTVARLQPGRLQFSGILPGYTIALVQAVYSDPKGTPIPLARYEAQRSPGTRRANAGRTVRGLVSSCLNTQLGIQGAR
jgi:hypothetical protein